MPRQNKHSSPQAPSAPQPPDTLGHSKGQTGRGKSPAPAGSSPEGLAQGLYVTATPIGNASDISRRALNILRRCAAIVAEDTRVSARLLALHGISRPLVSYNDHNAPKMRPKLLARLGAGEALVLISDAGTPLISDPGAKLIRAAREAGIKVFPIPGASAVLAALSVAGLPTDRFLFVGFLSTKAGERRRTLEELAAIPATLVFFESPRRLGETLGDMTEILGAREGFVAREMTKLYEEFVSGTLAELAARYAATEPKGEITVIVGPPGTHEAADIRQCDSLLRQALAHMPVKAASSLVADATGASRRAVYARALALKNSNDSRKG